MLLDTVEGKEAAADFDLLTQVAKHKATFFRSGWASYDTAKPGTLRLTPDKARTKDLLADYRAMAPMMFDERPRLSTRSLRNSKSFKTQSIVRPMRLRGEESLLARYGPLICAS